MSRGRTHPFRVLLILISVVASGSVARAGTPAAGSITPRYPLVAFTPADADTPLYVNPFEVVVTASRLRLPLRENPAATTVIGQGVLQALPRGAGLDEALKLVPGVRIDNQANTSRVHLSIRGQGILTENGIRGIKVLLDGLPLNDPSGVAPDLYDVDWTTVSRVEVQRGPAAALYGGGGAGGVLNIATANGAPGGPTPDFDASFGSNGYWKTRGEIGGATRDADYRVSASRTMGDGYRDHTAFWTNNVYGKMNWNPSPRVHLTQILAFTDYFEDNAEGLNIQQVMENPKQANPDAGKFDEYYKTDRVTIGTTGQIGTVKNEDVQFAGYFRMTRYKVPVPDNILHRLYITPGVSAQYNVHTGEGRIKNHFSLGSDLQWQVINEYTVENLERAVEGAMLSNEDIYQRGAGVFLLDRLELGKEWGVLASVRYDNIHNSLTDLYGADSLPGTNLSGTSDSKKATGQIGIAYTPVPRLSLYGNVGQGFLPPSTEELASNPHNRGGFNPDLKPATSVGEEIGGRGSLGRNLYYDLSLFHVTTEKDFDRYRVADRPLETFYANSGTSRRYGAEALLSCRPIDPLSMEVAYTYSNFKYTKTDTLAVKGAWLPNSPEHQLSVDVDYDVLPGLTVGVGTEVQTKWFINSSNTTEVDADGNVVADPSVNGFTLWNARLTYAWKLAGLQGELMVSGLNLLDRRYIAFTEPDPDGNSYQPGHGREVFGGVRLRL